MIFDLRVHKKSETNPLIIQQHFAEIKSQFPEYVTSYTYGSKDGGRVASGSILGDEAATLRLPLQASIFTTEARAILLALKLITIHFHVFNLNIIETLKIDLFTKFFMLLKF